MNCIKSRFCRNKEFNFFQNKIFSFFNLTYFVYYKYICKMYKLQNIRISTTKKCVLQTCIQYIQKYDYGQSDS